MDKSVKFEQFHFYFENFMILIIPVGGGFFCSRPKPFFNDWRNNKAIVKKLSDN